VNRLERCLIAAILLWACAAVAQFGAGVQNKKNAPQVRDLEGQVTTHGDVPLPDAIVYLNNTKTLAVKTFITDQNGNYRFPGLAPNVDYEVFAEYHGKKSDRKTLSSFDSRQKPYINLRIDTAK
jgi:hypothetical protein